MGVAHAVRRGPIIHVYGLAVSAVVSVVSTARESSAELRSTYVVYLLLSCVV